tara:strand:- start:768 stop:1322 length:555 start_codon:yes stop_codon:yes gene_type:complete
MNIHCSHTRKDLCEIIEIFDLIDYIEDYTDLGKKDLVLKLIDILDSLNNVIRDDEFLFIEDLQSLKNYLEKPNQTRVTVKEKSQLMDIAKDIIFYCKNEYLISASNFKCTDDIKNKADYISCYGNIPTIHRAITMLNKDPKIQPKINLIISGKIKIQMRKKQEAKLRQSVCLKKNHGLYVIDLS